MTMTIDLSPDAERALRDRAARQGIDAAMLAALLVRDGLSQPSPGGPPTDGPNPNQSTLEMFDRWAAEDAADEPLDPAEAAREWAEFRDAMNAHSTRGHPIYP